MIDMNKFCRVQPGYPTRWEFDKPFIRDGYQYSTDGRIAIRIKSSESDTGGNNPNVGALFSVEFTLSGTVPELITTCTVSKCSVCKGTCKTNAECEACGGDGRCLCSCGDEHDCCACDGTGEDADIQGECSACKGKGEKEEWNTVEILDFLYGGQYISLMQTELPGLKIVGQGNRGTLLFSFDGGQGLLMNTLKEVVTTYDN